MGKVKYIIPIVRQQDVSFFVELARELKESNGMSGVKIRYLTMRKLVFERLQNIMESNEEAFLIPNLLSSITLTHKDEARLVEIERQMCKACGIPLKVMLNAERFRPSEGSAARDFMWRHFKVIEGLVPENSLVLSERVDHLCFWLACDLARTRGGKYIGFSSSQRPTRWTKVTCGPTALCMPHKANDKSRQEVKKQICEIRNGVRPGYMYVSRSSFLERFCNFSIERKIIARRQLKAEIKENNYFAQKEVFFRFKRFLKLIRWWFHRREMKEKTIDEINGKFVYMALQLEPEASTCVDSPFFEDQKFWIDVVAKALPINVYLVIKENPKMWGDRDLSFYRTAIEHPEVIWIDPTTPTEKIIEKCAAVLTITGTVAIEAAALGKPVAMFGRAPFSTALKCIPVINGLTDLPSVLRRVLEDGEKTDKEVFEEQFATYIANLIPHNFVGTEIDDWTSTPQIRYDKEYGSFVRDALNSTLSNL